MKTPQIRYGLIREVIVMAFDTVRTNKLRSGLTVLGVVIGITSIVAMTALIRGFDKSLQDSIATAMGPRVIFLQRFGVISFASGGEFSELIKRPTLTIGDARALQEQATTLELVDIQVGLGPGPTVNRRIQYRDQKTRPMIVFGAGERYAEGTRIPMEFGRFFSGPEVQLRSNVAVLGNGAYQLLFRPSGIDPIGKTVRVGTDQFVVVGVFAARPSPGNFSLNQDDFVVMPYTTFQRVYGVRIVQSYRGRMGTPVMLSAIPREGISQEDAIAEIERVMRSRHGLRLDEQNDFDILTQDALMRVWDQISQATFFALVVISSIALMVGRHRRHGDHVDLGDRAHARDRRPPGARRAQTRSPVSVSDRSRRPDVGRRAAGHSPGQRHRPRRSLPHRVPGLAAGLVVRPRPRLFGHRRHRVRHVSGDSRGPAGSHRSAQVRVAR